jgi:murein L,D-transpeptidase YcbB/YkuD
MKYILSLFATALFCFNASAADITKLVIDRPTHTLTAYSGDEIVGSYDVIYGKPGSQTPALVTTFDTIDINPTWNPTAKSQRYHRQHPELIPQHGIKVRPDGSMYSPPGPKNPLGKARLNLKYGPVPIRVHGTSEPELFDTPNRQYSSGCVRVLKIQDLVTSLVSEQIDWSKPYTVRLTHPVEVIIK